jgi:hypothetical protein
MVRVATRDGNESKRMVSTHHPLKKQDDNYFLVRQFIQQKDT